MSKNLTVIGLACHILYFVLTVLSLGDYEYQGYGPGKAFKYMILSAYVAIICVTLYLIGAMCALIRNRRIFNIIRLLAVIISIPVGYNCIGYGYTPALIGNAYFLILFIIEIISLFLKDMKSTDDRRQKN